MVIIAVLGIFLTFKSFLQLNIGDSALYGYCICAIAFGYVERLKPIEAACEQPSELDTTSSD